MMIISMMMIFYLAHGAMVTMRAQTSDALLSLELVI